MLSNAKDAVLEGEREKGGYEAVRLELALEECKLQLSNERSGVILATRCFLCSL
jgi:hypothetical protein